MTNILVTGAFGYIGSTLVPALLAAGHRVTALDSLMYGSGLALAACMRDPNLEVVVGDARELEVIKPLVARADVLVPLAALVGAPACDRDHYASLTTNYSAVADLVGLASSSQLVVYPNTNSGYGRTGDAPVTEDAPLAPMSHYGRTKCAAENYVLDRQTNSVVLRLATVYGFSPRMRLDLLVNQLCWAAVRDGALTLYQGHHRRSVVHVADVAAAFLHVIDKFANPTEVIYAVDDSSKPPYRAEHRVFNVVGENVTKREVCRKIQEQIPEFVLVEHELRNDPDQRDYAVSNEQLRATGWQPQVNLDAGVGELVRGLPALLARQPHGNT